MKEQICADLGSLDRNQLHPQRLDRVILERQKSNGIHDLVRYRIKRNRLAADYFADQGKNLRSQMFESSLQKLLAMVKVPDLDFIVSLADSVDGADLPAPIFSFAKNASLHEAVILIPDFEALAGNVGLMKEVKKGMKTYPWEARVPKAFWRGSMTGLLFTKENFLTAPRSQAITLSLEQPQLIDAKFSMVTQCPDPDQILRSFKNYFSDSLSVREHLQYKYQLLIDGNSCAYSRAYWQLFSNSLIFKQDSPHIQWFYRALTPYVHYIPVGADFHDLVDKIKWAQNHDQEAKRIAKNAREFASQNLQKSKIYLYVYLLLQEYAKLQNLSGYGNDSGKM